MVEKRIEQVEATLERHGAAIYELQQSTNRLEAGQERQAVAIQDLSAEFGLVLGELGKLGNDFRLGKKEMMAAISNIGDNVGQIDATQKLFRQEWRGTCEERHKMVDFRLVKVEREARRSQEDIDKMSEHSKVQYINDLQGQLDEYSRQQLIQEKEHREDKRVTKRGWMTLAGIIIGGILTGSGGSILIAWLLQ